jgi:hypothetical protein
VIHRHVPDDFSNHLLTGLQKFIECDCFIRHALEPACKFLRDIEASRFQQFRERTIGADQINDESPTELITDPFIGQEITHVK